MIRNGFEGFALSSLGTLTIGDVEKRERVILFVGDGGSDARIHATGNETDREPWLLDVVEVDDLCCQFLRAAHQTPFTSGPRMYLCSCNCMRTFNPLAAIQVASCSRSICPHAGEIRTAYARACRSYSSITLLAYSQSPSSATTNLTSSRSARRRSRLDQSWRASSPDAGHLMSRITLARGSKPAVET